MKKIFSFLVAVFLLSSCYHFVDHREYFFIVQNDTDEDIFFIVDYTPSDHNYMIGSTYGWAKAGGQHKLYMDSWVKTIQDSVCVYVCYLESLRVNGTIQYDKELVKEEYLVSKLTIKKDTFLNIANTWPKILYYPPDPSADIQLYYY